MYYNFIDNSQSDDRLECETRVTTVVILSFLHLKNRKHVPCFYQVIETQVEVWENEKCCGNMSHR